MSVKVVRSEGTWVEGAVSFVKDPDSLARDVVSDRALKCGEEVRSPSAT